MIGHSHPIHACQSLWVGFAAISVCLLGIFGVWGHFVHSLVLVAFCGFLSGIWLGLARVVSLTLNWDFVGFFNVEKFGEELISG